MKTTFVAQFGRCVLNAVALCALCGCLNSNILAADPQPIDFNRAQQLFNKAKQGEKLSPEDQAYLDRAKAARRKGQEGKAAKGGEKGKPDRGHTAPPPPRDSTGLIPLDQMTAQDNYKGQDGGLYGGGKNQPPAAHLKAALAEAGKIVPLDERGKPSPKGKIVLLSLGMSNTTMEYSVFKKLADADPAKSPRVAIVDAAQGGKDAEKWNDANSPMWEIAEGHLKRAGVTPQQVEAVWFKQARIDPAKYGEFPKHNEEMIEHIVKNLQIAKKRYPNLRIVYLSTRIYGGYALTGLNPEPYAYENGFAIRDLILKQIKGDAALNYDPAKGEVKAPLLLWGPYLWADGLTPRKSDGLVWKVDDFRENDRTHPSVESGREKVAKLLLNFLKTDSTSTPWFLVGSAGREITELRTNPLSGFYWMVGFGEKGIPASREQFQKYLSRVDATFASNPHLRGAYVQIPWNGVEAAAGKLDFERLDALIQVCRKHRKFYKLVLMPGTHTPAYVYEQGAEGFQTVGQGPFREDYQKPLRIPLPWDPIYQKHFFQALDTIANHYAGDALCEAVAVTVAQFESCEMSLPAEAKDMEKWASYGDYKTRLKDCWIQAIDHYGTVFARQRICLEASSLRILPGMDKEMQEIIEHGIARYGRRFSLQTDQLDGRRPITSYRTYNELLKYRDRLTLGFQNVAGWQGEIPRLRQGTMEMTAYNFAAMNASYLELWYGDGGNATTCSELHKLVSQAQRMGPEAYKAKLQAEGKFLNPGDYKYDRDEVAKKKRAKSARQAPSSTQNP